MLKSFLEKNNLKVFSSHKKCKCNGEYEINRIYKEFDKNTFFLLILLVMLITFFVITLRGRLLHKIYFLLIICSCILILFLDYKLAYPIPKFYLFLCWFNELYGNICDPILKIQCSKCRRIINLKVYNKQPEIEDFQNGINQTELEKQELNIISYDILKFRDNELICKKRKNELYFLQNILQKEINQLNDNIILQSKKNIDESDINNLNGIENIERILNKLKVKNDELKKIKNILYEINSNLAKISTSKNILREWILKDENKLEMEDTKCLICLEAPQEGIFAPCGHRCCCLNHAKILKDQKSECPLCRVKIESYIKQVFSN